MRFLTYNIWNYSGDWPRRREALLEIIQSEAPDVVALQEVRHTWNDRPGNNQARWFAERLGYHCFYRPANIFWPFPPVVEGLALLTPRPAQHAEALRVPHMAMSGPRRVILKATVGGVDVYNVHFPLTERARIMEAAQLSALVTRRGRVALAMGDFNADSHQPPMTVLGKAGFVDLWQALADPGRPAAWPTNRRIDYVLAFGSSSWQGTIKVLGARPDSNGISPSDHPGLLADLRM